MSPTGLKEFVFASTIVVGYQESSFAYVEVGKLN